MTDRPTPSSPERGLPEDLLDLALERLHAVAAPARAAVCAELAASWPAHTEALQALLADVVAAEHTLDDAFPDGEDELPLAIGDLPVRCRLGEGAFGTVYLCTQSEPVQRPVAVKVLRPGAGDRQTLRRFAAEQQMLATLRHPAIAHVYDAGRLPDGRPFFVMEFVDGSPITTWCAERRPSVVERLRLFVALCHGIAHAHAHGVVHRDLKPGNVLVVDLDGRPQPKIIDFGIAKALATAPTPDGESTPQTDAGRVLGTPGYMSPEQATGDGSQVDERADVFGLGVLLYELLTGDLPWPRGATPWAATPALASARVHAQASTADGAERQELHRLAARLRGDLDWISRKATALAREDRYATAAELATDIERHLAGRTVSARAPSLRYRTAKFVRRHRVATAALAVAMLATGGALAYATWQAHTAAAQAVLARGTVEHLLLRIHELGRNAPGASEGVREALAADALACYERWLGAAPDDPALRAGRGETLVLLAQVHQELGQYDAALSRAEAAHTAATQLLPQGHDAPAVRALAAKAAFAMARALMDLGRPDEARTRCREAEVAFARLAAERTEHGFAHYQVMRQLGALELRAAAPARAVRSFERAVELLTALPPDQVTAVQRDEQLADCRLRLAAALAYAGADRRARALLPQIDAWLAASGRPVRVHAGDLALRGKLGLLLGDLDDAVHWHALALTMARRWGEQEPRQIDALELQRGCLEDLAVVHHRRSAWSACDAAMADGLAVADAIVQRQPDVAAQQDLRRQLTYGFAHLRHLRQRRSALPQAERWLAPTRDAASTFAARERTPAPWQIELLRLQIAAGLGTTNAEAWRQLAAGLPREVPTARPADHQAVAEAWLALAAAHDRSGDVAAATAAAAQLDVLATTGRAVWTTDLQVDRHALHARLALRRGDVASFGEAWAALLAADGSTRTRWLAGLLASSAWQAARDAGDEDAAALRSEQARDLLPNVLAELVAPVAAHPDEPQLALPWGQAAIALATLEAAAGENAAALLRLDAALPVLQGIADEAPADLWDAAQLTAASALQRRLRSASVR